MRIVFALAVGVIGCAVTYVAAGKLTEIGEMILGPTAGPILGIIVALSGVAITIAVAIGVAKSDRTKPS